MGVTLGISLSVKNARRRLSEKTMLWRIFDPKTK
jgi:hypothetical protein